MARKRYAIPPKNFEEPNNRVFLDPFWLNEAWRKDPKAVIKRLESCVSDGGVLVTTVSILDMIIFQKNLPFLDILVSKDHLIPEYQDTPEEIAERRFYWSCDEKVTYPSKNLEDAVKGLQSRKGILAVREHVMDYAKPYGAWEKGQMEADAVTEQMKIDLSVDEKASRSDVMIACDENNKPGMRESYNSRHIMRIGAFHRCDGIFYADGSISLRVSKRVS